MTRYLAGSVGVQHFVLDDEPQPLPLLLAALGAVEVATHGGVLCVGRHLEEDGGGGKRKQRFACGNQTSITFDRFDPMVPRLWGGVILRKTPVFSKGCPRSRFFVTNLFECSWNLLVFPGKRKGCRLPDRRDRRGGTAVACGTSD